MVEKHTVTEVMATAGCGNKEKRIGMRWHLQLFQDFESGVHAGFTMDRDTRQTPWERYRHFNSTGTTYIDTARLNFFESLNCRSGN